MNFLERTFWIGSGFAVIFAFWFLAGLVAKVFAYFFMMGWEVW